MVLDETNRRLSAALQGPAHVGNQSTDTRLVGANTRIREQGPIPEIGSKGHHGAVGRLDWTAVGPKFSPRQAYIVLACS